VVTEALECICKVGEKTKNSQEEFDQYFEVDGVQTILKSTIG
jgi:hypothetical protein